MHYELTTGAMKTIGMLMMITNTSVNEISEAVYNTKRNKGANDVRRRPSNVINKFPDNDKPYITTKRINHTPGLKSYAGSINDGKKVCIIGDSIIQRIRLKDISNQIKNGTAYKKVYVGGSAVEEIEWNAHKVLERKNIDTVILSMGSNNVSSKHSSVTSEI